MIKFFSQTEVPERKLTPSGTKFLNVYQEEIAKDGTKHLVKTGQTNIYDKIQSSLEETKVENILKAVAMGDLSMLQAQKPTYIDATTLPKTLMEAQNIVLKAKQEFENLPIKIKNLFDNNAELYVSQIGTKEFLEKMAPFNKELREIKKAGSQKAYNEKVAAAAKFEKDVAAAKEVSNES